MDNEFIIGGIYISTVVPAAVLGVAVTVALSVVLSRIGFYRLVWHRPMVEVAIFCIAFAAFATTPIVGVAA